MYTNTNLDIIQDNAQYTDSEGNQYPRKFPKSAIAELFPVTLTTCPENLTIDGYHIELISEVYTQVWDTSALPAKTWADVDALQNSMLSATSSVIKRIIRYQTQLALTAKTPKENSTKYQALLQYCQDVRDNDETNHTGDPQAALDALNAMTEPT